jgi:hypothetical protein
MSDVTPINTSKSIPSKVEDPDRMALNEIFMEMVAMKNGMSAMETKIQALTMEIELWKTKIEPMQLRGVEMQKQFDIKVKEVKERLGIPEGWDIDTKTGNTFPKQPTPQR